MSKFTLSVTPSGAAPFSAKSPSEMTIKELKLAISNIGLVSQALGFSEKSEFISLLENHLAIIGPDSKECPVCMIELNLSVKSICLPCRHLLCKICFQTIHSRAISSGSSDSCPLCRTVLPQNASSLAIEAQTLMATAEFSPVTPADKAMLHNISETKLRASLALDPDDIGCLTTLSDLVRHRGEEGIDEAHELCCRAICMHPTSYYGYASMAHVHEKRGNKEAQKACYMKALSCEETSDVLANLGSLYFSLDNFEEALRCHRRAVELRPEDPIILFNLAVTLEDGDIDVEEAIRLYTRALKLDTQGIYLTAINDALVAARAKLEA